MARADFVKFWKFSKSSKIRMLKWRAFRSPFYCIRSFFHKQLKSKLQTPCCAWSAFNLHYVKLKAPLPKSSEMEPFSSTRDPKLRKDILRWKEHLQKYYSTFIEKSFKFLGYMVNAADLLQCEKPCLTWSGRALRSLLSDHASHVKPTEIMSGIHHVT